MDYDNASKTDLLIRCAELQITKCKSKTRQELIKLICDAESGVAHSPHITPHSLLHLRALVRWNVFLQMTWLKGLNAHMMQISSIL